MTNDDVILDFLMKNGGVVSTRYMKNEIVCIKKLGEYDGP